MAIVLIQTPPAGVNLEMVAQVGKEMDVHANPPEGLIVHTAIDGPDGPQVIDVWESQEQFERFREERLMPAIAKVAADAGGPPPEQPKALFYEVLDLVRGH